MKVTRRAVIRGLAPVGAALVTLLAPLCLLVVAVQRGPDCTPGTRYPWAGQAFFVAAVTAVCLTLVAWFVPGWRRRHLASGATVGLALLAVMTLLVFGGLSYQASLPC